LNEENMPNPIMFNYWTLSWPFSNNGQRKLTRNCHEIKIFWRSTFVI
jgi:hypothetical protein